MSLHDSSEAWLFEMFVALHSAYCFAILFIQIGSLYTVGLTSTDTLHSWKSLCMIIMLWHRTQTLTYWCATFTFSCTHTQRVHGLIHLTCLLYLLGLKTALTGHLEEEFMSIPLFFRLQAQDCWVDLFGWWITLNLACVVYIIYIHIYTIFD